MDHLEIYSKEILNEINNFIAKRNESNELFLDKFHFDSYNGLKAGGYILVLIEWECDCIDNFKLGIHFYGSDIDDVNISKQVDIKSVNLDTVKCLVKEITDTINNVKYYCDIDELCLEDEIDDKRKKLSKMKLLPSLYKIDTCCVCLNETLGVLSCNHSVCKMCKYSLKNNICPICRGEFWGPD